MGVVFYNIFLLLFKAGISIASLFRPKAAKWVRGRRKIFEQLEKAIPAGERVIWIHCASLGEFEQGRPIIEALRAQRTGHRILLTFFSPSGYEIRKDYPGADWVFYLPIDGPRNAKRFLEIVHPSLVIFVKYEFWYYYLKKIKYRDIPLLLVSALFRRNMTFFKWYGGLQRKMLSRFDHLFVQDAASKKLMEQIGLGHLCSVSGDTRFDRVIEIASKFEPVQEIERFIGNEKAIVAGSTWKQDEALLQKAFIEINDPSLKLIIAPHEIDEKSIAEAKKLFPQSILYSELTSNQQPVISNILIIDNVGMLSRLYKYAWLTYVGGGLTSNGVHNVLEAAVYNKIVLFGPYYQKYREAIGLVQSGGGIPLNSSDHALLARLIQAMLTEKEEYAYRSKAAGDFVRSNAGATARILSFIQEKRLLTN